MSSDPLNILRELLLRLSDVIPLRFHWVTQKDPVRLFPESMRFVTVLPVQVTPNQLQTVVDVPQPVLFHQLAPLVFSCIAMRASHCDSSTSVTVEQNDKHELLRVLQVSDAY